MMKKIKQLLTHAALSGMLLVPFALPAAAVAQPDIQGNLCQGANLNVSEDCDVDDGEAADRVNSLLEDVINIFSLVVGVVAVIMIIIGGLRYITSGGDTGNVSAAKNTILYAIIGLVIVALSQVIVRFVLGRVAGSE